MRRRYQNPLSCALHMGVGGHGERERKRWSFWGRAASVAAATRRASLGAINPGDVLYPRVPGSVADQNWRTGEFRHHGGTADACKRGSNRRRPLYRGGARPPKRRRCFENRRLERSAGTRAVGGGAISMRDTQFVLRDRDQRATP